MSVIYLFYYNNKNEMLLENINVKNHQKEKILQNLIQTDTDIFVDIKYFKYQKHKKYPDFVLSKAVLIIENTIENLKKII